MNICFFNLQEHSGVATEGGIERASFLLAKELRRRGHCVEFYYSKSSRRFNIPFISALLPSSRSEGASFQKFLKKHKIYVAVWHGGGENTPFSVKNLPCELVMVWHSVPRFNTQFYTDAIIRKLKFRSRFTQWIVRSKPFSFLFCSFFESCRSRFFSYALHYCNKFVLLSEEFFTDFIYREKFPTKVCAIPNIAPYETQNISFSEKKKELLWLGRVEFTQKRPDLMLQIWKRLQCRFSDWSLRFVGDGSYLPELKDLAASLKLKNVFVEGFQDPVSYYRSASIFCMTSAFEGFGLVLVEAQAYGCVPIAFDSYSSVCDIIEDGVNGILVPPFDLDVYAEKLSELMSNTELRAKLGSAAQKNVARFSPEAIGDKWEKLLQSLV